jgi:hypothetical protein
VKVQGDQCRPVLKEILIKPDGTLEFAGRARILQIAQMLG